MFKSKQLKFIYSDAHFYSDYVPQNIQAVNVDEIKAFYVNKCGDHYNVMATTKLNEIIVVRSLFANDGEARLYVDRLVNEINSNYPERHPVKRLNAQLVSEG